MTRTVKIVHVSPTLVPLYRVITEGVADGGLIEASAFGAYFPPDVLAACMNSSEYDTLRGIILHYATGMDLQFGQVADLETTAHALALVHRNVPSRYLELRGQISHAQLVDMAPISDLHNYLFSTTWWKSHWNQNGGDVKAPSARTLIAALDAIDKNGILTPAQKFAQIRDISGDLLDTDTLRTIYKAVLYAEHVEGKLATGGASTSVAQFANNSKLVAQIPPEHLMEIVYVAIKTYANVVAEVQTDPAYAHHSPQSDEPAVEPSGFTTVGVSPSLPPSLGSWTPAADQDGPPVPVQPPVALNATADETGSVE